VNWTVVLILLVVGQLVFVAVMLTVGTYRRRRKDRDRPEWPR
jgi:heme/copper-type cytochrome/quinol oxidase subunit 2